MFYATLQFIFVGPMDTIRVALDGLTVSSSAESSPTSDQRMAFRGGGQSTAGPSQQFPNAAFAGLTTSGSVNQASRSDDPQFDIFEWYPQYQSCQRYFLDYA